MPVPAVSSSPATPASTFQAGHSPSRAEPVPFKTIEVALQSNPYPVVIGAGGLAQLGTLVAQQGFGPGTKVLVVSNPDVEALYGAPALASLQAAGFEATTLVVEAGEQQKTPATIGLIQGAAFERKLERRSLLVALGGGWSAT